MSSPTVEVPRLFKGGLAVDDRGEVGFVNDFNFEGVRRFYTIANHRQGFVRAWHGHKREAKYMTVTSGSMLVCCVAIDNWVTPSAGLEVHRYVLSAKLPTIIWIPAGYANGFMSLTEDAKLMVFSTATLEESLQDDIRFPSNTWNPWHVEER